MRDRLPTSSSPSGSSSPTTSSSWSPTPLRVVRRIARRRRKPPPVAFAGARRSRDRGQRRHVTVPRADRHPRRPPSGVRSLDGAHRHLRRARLALRVRPRGHARSSSTSRCSNGSGSPPTSSARRCTSSKTRAGAGSRSGPRAPRRSCGRSCSTARRCRGRSGTWRRTSATSARRRAGTASTGRSGVEVLGVDDPDVDVEVIALADGFYRALGLERFTLFLNSMGDPTSRSSYVEKLQRLPARARRRARRRLPRAGGAEPAACARQQARRLAGRDRARAADHRAPQRRVASSTSSACRRVSTGWASAYELAPRLVRGFDYYTSTTFEFLPDLVDAAQTSIGGGGRYDQLAEQLGGRAHARDRLRDGHRARPDRVRRRRRVLARAAARRRVRRQRARRGRRRRGREPCRGAPRERAAGRACVRRPLGEGAMEGGRQVACGRTASCSGAPKPNATRSR